MSVPFTKQKPRRFASALASLTRSSACCLVSFGRGFLSPSLTNSSIDNFVKSFFGPGGSVGSLGSLGFFLGGSSLGGSTLDGSSFGGSAFGGSSFGGSTFGGSSFGGSTFGGSSFGGSVFGG